MRMILALLALAAATPAAASALLDDRHVVAPAQLALCLRALFRAAAAIDERGDGAQVQVPLFSVPP